MSDSPDYWLRGKRIELIDEVTLVDTIGTIALITAISNIVNIESLDLVDLITKVSEVTTVGTINAITNILNIESIDLIDRITLIDEITEISKVRGLHWYDRNASIVVKAYYGFEQSPHALTERWAYTVPTDKLAYVEVLQADIHRTKVATSVDYAGSYVRLTPYGESYSNFLEAFLITNTVGDRAHRILGQSMLLVDGDKLQGYTYDLSTGGECYLLVNAKLTEFDE